MQAYIKIFTSLIRYQHAEHLQMQKHVSVRAIDNGLQTGTLKCLHWHFRLVLQLVRSYHQPPDKHVLRRHKSVAKLRHIELSANTESMRRVGQTP